MKKTLLLLLVVLLPIDMRAQSYQDPETGVNYDFDVNKKNARVISSNAVGDITILSHFSYDGEEYTVWCIADEAFKDCSELTSITIPNSVVLILDRAFYGCNSLTEVHLLSDYCLLGSECFSNYDATLYVPTGTKERYMYDERWNKFANMVDPGEKYVYQDPVTKVNYEYSLADWPEATVMGTPKAIAGSPDVSGDITILSSFIVDGKEYSVTSIGRYAFSECEALTSVNIPNSVTFIDAGAFCKCI